MAAAFLVGVSPVTAQEKAELSVSVELGWQGTMTGDRWAPITVSISPGEAPLSGMVVAEYPQDASGMARYSVPFAATPGLTTPVHLMAALPEMCWSLELAVIDEAGLTRWSRRYEAVGQSMAQPMPTLINSQSPVVALAGRNPLFEAIRDWPAIVATSSMADDRGVAYPETDGAWTHFAAVRADITSLPASWIAYDGLAAVVVTPEEPPDPRAVEAIHTWVASGGRLFVRVDAPGDRWQTWVPAAIRGGVTVEPARSIAVPAAARAPLQRIVSRVRSIKESPDKGSGIVGVDAPLPVVAESMVARPMRVSEDGLWVAHWTEREGGLVVEGAHGLGSVVLLGFNPANCTSAASTSGAGAVWRAAMDPAMGDILQLAGRQFQADRGWNTNSTPVQSAINTALERIAQVPGVGVGVFIFIVACVLVLSMLVGPFDFVLLRRLRALQGSWLTALAWIGAASIAAYAGPRLVRTEITRVNRVSVEDCIGLPLDGASVPGAGGPVAFRTGLSGVYAGESGELRFVGADPASWWRGVSVRYADQPPERGRGVIPIVQRAAGGLSGSQRGGPLLDLPMALWTFRSFTDESMPPPTIGARVVEREDGWSVLVSGLPEGARVMNAALRVGDQWCTARFVPRVRVGGPGSGGFAEEEVAAGPVGTMDGTVWTASFSRAFAESGVPVPWAEAMEPQDVFGFEEAPLDTRPGALEHLPGPARRTRAFERLVRTGKWATVLLDVSDWPIDTPVSWNSEVRHTRVLRVLAPLQHD